MAQSGPYVPTRTLRPKRLLSKTKQPLQQRPRISGGRTPQARTKVCFVKEQSAVTIASHPGSFFAGGYYESEIRDLRKRVAEIEKQPCEIAVLTERLDSLTRKMEKIEERLRWLGNPPLPGPPRAANPPVRRHLVFNADPQPNPPMPTPNRSVPASPRTPAPATPLPDITLRDLSSEREQDLYAQCFQRGQHQPDVYASSIFMALAPFGEYQCWGRTVNWSGSNGKASLPHNLKESVHRLLTRRFPGLSVDQWQKIRNKINERLRSPRKVDPEAHRPGFK